MDSYSELKRYLENLISDEFEFFSGMKSKSQLGRIVEIANQGSDYEKKAEKFLSLIRG